MAAGGGIHVHEYNVLFAVLVLDHGGNVAGNLGGIGVADADAVLLQFVAQFSHLVHQIGHGVHPALGGTHGHHFTLLAHVDEGTHADEGAHRGRQSAHTAAAAEELQVIGKEIHGEFVYLGLGPFQNLVQRFAGLHQVSHFPHNGVADGGNALGINFFEAGLGVLGLELGNGLVHGVEGVGHGPGEVNV